MTAKFKSLFIALFIVFTPHNTHCINLRELGGQHFQGRYTRDVGDFEILIPRKVDHEGNFVSYSLPHSYNIHRGRIARSIPSDEDKIHFGLSFDGKEHMVEVWPNQAFLSPGLVLESWGEGAASDLNKVKIRSAKTDQCHYTGKIQEAPDTKVAVSLCNGMAGHIRTKRHHYYIEPVKDHEPEADGQHLHIIYTRSASTNRKRTCGVQGDWRSAWSSRLNEEYAERNGAQTDLKADHKERLKKFQDSAPVKFADGKRSAHSKVNYLELLLVADKKFLQHHNGTDYEQYLFTILNMVSDLFHDASVGNQIDVTLVRVIYLEKEEEELDLMINTDADATLKNFCNWSDKMNFDVSHPNHHDIAVLVTTYDICVEKDCATAGLAYVAGACSNKPLGCAYCEDKGLDLGTIMTHEIGHLLGSQHDSDDKSPSEGLCPAMADDYRIHVMAPWSQYSTSNWSACSRKYITEFLENDLGKCFLDEPQEHDFKMPEMPPGVVYDATWQCTQIFGASKPCDMGPEKNCKQLACKDPKGKDCLSTGDPPADGTSCGNNKWCFERQCVDIGGRPAAVNGEWGSWSSWSECSRTCGGGASYMERLCDNPTPANHGRFCIGSRRKYKLCNTEPCEENSLTFREVQCKEHNTEELQWVPFEDEVPEHVCALVCSNNKLKFKILAPRVKDGTSCKRGSRDKCIAGECRKIGCDWVLDSDAVEDKCGVCNGDGTTCTTYEKIFNETKKQEYQKLIVIPAGCRKITVEEMKASDNYLALGAADGKTFFLNGNYQIDEEGESKVAGTVCVYSEVEPGRETIVIGGPLKEDLAIYMLNNGTNNPGIQCRYSCPRNNTNGTTTCKFHWELVEWGPCSAFCGGGSQTAEPSCIDNDGGKVANKFCEKIPKPHATSRVCNDQPCKTRWRASEWGKCDGCEGVRYRLVECVKESPFSDCVIITDDKYCKKKKPVEKEACTSKKQCQKSAASVNEHELDIIHEKNNNRDKNTGKEIHPCKNGKDDSDSTQVPLVVDKVPAEKLKVYKIPLIEDNKKMNISDAAMESIGDSVPSIVDESKAKVLKGKEALKELKETKKLNRERENRDDDKKENGKSCQKSHESKQESSESDKFKMSGILSFTEPKKELQKYDNTKEFKKETDIKENCDKIHEKVDMDQEKKYGGKDKIEEKLKEESQYDEENASSDDKLGKEEHQLKEESKNNQEVAKRSKIQEKEKKKISKYNKKINLFKTKSYKDVGKQKPESKYHKKVKFFERNRRKDKENTKSKDVQIEKIVSHREQKLVEEKKNKEGEKEHEESKLTNKVKKNTKESNTTERDGKIVERKDVKAFQKRCQEECINDVCDKECGNECGQDCKDECDECQKKCDDDTDEDEQEDCDDECEDECDTKGCEEECAKDCRKQCDKDCVLECENKVKKET